MSVEKVNRYKQQKEARAKALKKDKIESMVATALVVIIAIAIVLWILWSIFGGNSKKGTDATTVNVDAINNYLESFEYAEPDSGATE